MIHDDDAAYRRAMRGLLSADGEVRSVDADADHAAPVEAEYAFMRDAIDTHEIDLDALADAALDGDTSAAIDALAEGAANAVRRRILDLGLVDTGELLRSVRSK